VACEVCGVGQQLVDLDARTGNVRGSVAFGPLHRNGAVFEQGVTEYRIHVVDSLGQRLSSTLATVPPAGAPQSGCCQASAYSVAIQAELPDGFSRFAITAVVEGVELPTRILTEPILDLVGPVAPPPMPLPSTTTTLASGAYVNVLLQVESPRREELLGDVPARKAVSRGLGEVTRLLPEPAVELGPFQRDAEDPHIVNLSFALLTKESNVPQAASRLASVDLGLVEQAIQVELALIDKPSYNVRVLGLWTTSGNTLTSASPILTLAPLPESQGEGERTATGSALVLGLSIAFCLVCCLACMGTITAYIFRGPTARNQRTHRVVAPMVASDGVGFADICRAPGDDATRGESIAVPEERPTSLQSYALPVTSRTSRSVRQQACPAGALCQCKVTSHSVGQEMDEQQTLALPGQTGEQQGPAASVSPPHARRPQPQDPLARVDIHSIKVIHANQ